MLTAQFTQEQSALIEAEIQRRIGIRETEAAAASERQRQQLTEFQASNHAFAMELSARHALDQGQRDLFPQDEWEDPGEFEAGSAITHGWRI